MIHSRHTMTISDNINLFLEKWELVSKKTATIMLFNGEFWRIMGISHQETIYQTF